MLDKFAYEAQHELSKQLEESVKDFLRYEFAISQNMSVHRPRWMPNRVYRWLMRTILIERTPLRTTWRRRN